MKLLLLALVEKALVEKPQAQAQAQVVLAMSAKSLQQGTVPSLAIVLLERALVRKAQTEELVEKAQAQAQAAKAQAPAQLMEQQLLGVVWHLLTLAECCGKCCH